jgi:hypothetical protein
MLGWRAAGVHRGPASPTVPGSRTITLLSGEKPLPTYTIENGKYAGETGETRALPHSSRSRPYGWSLIDGTKWVLVPGGPGADLAVNHAAAPCWLCSEVHTDYVVTFRLPKGFTAASISVLVLADDSAEVFLNETSLGRQPTRPDRVEGNLIGDPWPFSTEKASLSRPGVNTLRFRVMDIGGGTGLDYSATITYLP